MKVRDKYKGGSQSVWLIRKMIGYPEPLGGDYALAWEFLTTATERWPWLIEVFGGVKDYRAALAAYYMALNVNELVTDMAEGWTKDYETAQINYFVFNVPPTFLLDEGTIQQRAFTLLTRKPEALNVLWERKGLQRADVAQVWPHWIRLLKQYHGARARAYVYHLPLEELFERIDG